MKHVEVNLPAGAFVSLLLSAPFVVTAALFLFYYMDGFLHNLLSCFWLRLCVYIMLPQ
jgi:hypothetical protein